jgi:peroxiredoxin (alkyl hydroperoxide reductase subunit C)
MHRGGDTAAGPPGSPNASGKAKGLPVPPPAATARPNFTNQPIPAMPVLVGKKAPSFTAKAVAGNTIIEDFSLDQFLGKKYVIFFFYPKDFTFVCPTELHRFQEEIAEFESRDVAVVGCSTDSEFSHWAWLQTPKAKGGIEGVTYPLVADVNKTISDAYDVLAGDYDIDETGSLVVRGELVAYRGLFLIDKEGIVRHQVVNDMPLGRSIREALRLVDALQHFEQFGEVCPMDWNRGDKAMKPDHEGVSDYLAN